MMKYLFSSMTVAALALAAASPATATDVSLTTTLNGSSTPVCLGSCHLHATGDSTTQTFDMTVGGPAQTVTLGTAWIDAGFGYDTDATLNFTLNFTDPAFGSDSGSAMVEYVRLGGFLTHGVTGGSITFDDPMLDFTIGKYGFEFDPHNLAGWTSGPVNLTGSLKMVSGPVPEPASWAMMLGGFGLVGGAMRSRRKTAVAFG